MSFGNLKKYGIIEDRWNTKDKISIYRGITKLNERNMKTNSFSMLNLRRRNHSTIRKLRDEVNTLRMDLQNVTPADKLLLRTTLQCQRDILLPYQQHIPEVACDFLDYLTNKKKKQLDRINYKKTDFMNKLKQLQLEKSRMKASVESISDVNQMFKEQVVIGRMQDTMKNYQAALIKKSLYEKILNYMKKDALVFDRVLKTLHGDSALQCKCVMNVAQIGMVASDMTTNFEDEFKLLEQNVIDNMRIRDKALKEIRSYVQALFVETKLLTRSDSEEEIKIVKPTVSDIALPMELDDLEEIMDKLRKNALVSAYDDIFPRLQDQYFIKEWLLQQLDTNFKLRNKLQNMRNHAELKLLSLEHTMSESSYRFKDEKKRLLDTIQHQEEVTTMHQTEMEDIGKQLFLLRISLQTIYDMLEKVREPTDIDDDDVEEEEIQFTMEGGVAEEETEEVAANPPREDILQTLCDIKAKLRKLISHVSEYLDEEEFEMARIMYQKKLIEKIGKVEFGESDDIEFAMTLDLDMDDLVVTRNEIKRRSQKIVDQYEKTLFPM